MKYKNTKTGAIIDSPCVISGGDWIEYKKEVAKEAVEVKEVIEETKVEVVKENEDIEGFDGITVKQIKQELDAFGVKYNPRANKQELYDLMMQGR